MFDKLVRPALLLAASASLGACSMYDGYGGSVVSVGYGSGGYYPYSSRYDSYGYYGWYDGFYYPGTGYYIYDRAGTRHRWSDRHRRYWEGRRGGREVRENWSGWRGEQYAGRQPDRRDQRDWRGRDQRPQAWQGNRQRDDRQRWQGGNRRGNEATGPQRAPQRAERQQRVERQERAERRDRSVDRGREFRRGRDRRDD